MSTVIFRAALFDGDDAKITSGTTSLRLWHVVATDGTLESFNWTTGLFVAPATSNTAPTVSMTHRTVNESGSTYNTGVWTYYKTYTTEFEVGEKYLAEITHTSLPRPIVIEWQAALLVDTFVDGIPFVWSM
jgi:hypothetical protein